MKARIEIPSIEIAAFCRRWQIIEMSLFGSVLRDDAIAVIEPIVPPEEL
ncbi:MAG: hypothetical protein V1899_08465 [Planctomycetota bacterium]